MKFLTNGGIDIGEIGVLTTYKSQKKLIKQVLELAKNVRKIIIE